jgi:signal recognition particle subunit SRP54
MFENLTSRLSKSLKNISGKGRLSHANIQDALRDVRKALLEADVALPVVKDFVDKVRKRAVGQEVARALSPSQQFIKIVQDELTAKLVLFFFRHQ